LPSALLDALPAFPAADCAGTLGNISGFLLPFPVKNMVQSDAPAHIRLKTAAEHSPGIASLLSKPAVEMYPLSFLIPENLSIPDKMPQLPELQ